MMRLSRRVNGNDDRSGSARDSRVRRWDQDIISTLRIFPSIPYEKDAGATYRIRHDDYLGLLRLQFTAIEPGLTVFNWTKAL